MKGRGRRVLNSFVALVYAIIKDEEREKNEPMVKLEKDEIFC
jgi:hypothetical protein